MLLFVEREVSLHVPITSPKKKKATNCRQTTSCSSCSRRWICASDYFPRLWVSFHVSESARGHVTAAIKKIKISRGIWYHHMLCVILFNLRHKSQLCFCQRLIRIISIVVVAAAVSRLEVTFDVTAVVARSDIPTAEVATHCRDH